MRWVIVGEENEPDVGVKIEEHEQNNRDEENTAETANESLDDDAELWKRFHEL